MASVRMVTVLVKMVIMDTTAVIFHALATTPITTSTPMNKLFNIVAAQVITIQTMTYTWIVQIRARFHVRQRNLAFLMEYAMALEHVNVPPHSLDWIAQLETARTTATIMDVRF